MSGVAGALTSGGGGFRWRRLRAVNTFLQRLRKICCCGTRATLDGADFEGSWFSSTNFEGASLRGTSFRLCNVKCANFRRADLTSACFQLSGVEAADFKEAILVGASFEGASYYGYTIHDGDGFPNDP
jgi:uncharacterized protein YjbI with pentapeptide repeats